MADNSTIYKDLICGALTITQSTGSVNTTGEITGEMAKVQTTQPSTQVGDLWFDTDEAILNPYGSMYGDDVTITVTVSASETYYAMGAGLSSGALNGFTHANSVLTVPEAGVYEIVWSATGKCATANQNISVAVMVNSTAKPETEGSEKFTTANDAVGMAGNGILSLSANDAVKFCVENETAGNDIIITHACMTIKKLSPPITGVLKVYDGDSWENIQSSSKTMPTRSLQLFGDFRGMYNVSTSWILLNMAQAASVFAAGITITSWSLDCSTAAPTTQIAGDLKYCDALASGAFPGGSATLIKAIDTTTGNSGETGVSYSVPASKILYLSFDSDPTDYNTTWNLVVNYTVG